MVGEPVASQVCGLEGASTASGAEPRRGRASLIEHLRADLSPRFEDRDDMVLSSAVRALTRIQGSRALGPLRDYATAAKNGAQSPGSVAEAPQAIDETGGL